GSRPSTNTLTRLTCRASWGYCRCRSKLANSRGGGIVRRLGTLLATVALLAAVSPIPAGAAAPVSFPDGVASGDVTPISAVLWTRADQATTLTAEVSTDPSFALRTLRFPASATASADFTAKIVVAPLVPNHRYFYRFRHDGSVS